MKRNWLSCFFFDWVNQNPILSFSIRFLVCPFYLSVSCMVTAQKVCPDVLKFGLKVPCTCLNWVAVSSRFYSFCIHFKIANTVVELKKKNIEIRIFLEIWNFVVFIILISLDERADAQPGRAGCLDVALRSSVLARSTVKLNNCWYKSHTSDVVFMVKVIFVDFSNRFLCLELPTQRFFSRYVRGSFKLD